MLHDNFVYIIICFSHFTYFFVDKIGVLRIILLALSTHDVVPRRIIRKIYG